MHKIYGIYKDRGIDAKEIKNIESEIEDNIKKLKNFGFFEDFKDNYKEYSDFHKLYIDANGLYTRFYKTIRVCNSDKLKTIKSYVLLFLRDLENAMYKIYRGYTYSKNPKPIYVNRNIYGIEKAYFADLTNPTLEYLEEASENLKKAEEKYRLVYKLITKK